MTLTGYAAVGAGDGILLRVAGALLFLPDGGDRLAAAFREAPPGERMRSVCDAVLDDVAGAPRCALVLWPESTADDDITIMVRGDITISSDLPSCPTLSGAGSATWSEHRVPRRPVSARLECGTAADERTALQAGTVLAGGFRLDLELTQSTDSDDAPGATAHPSPPAHDTAHISERAATSPTVGSSTAPPPGMPTAVPATPAEPSAARPSEPGDPLDEVTLTESDRDELGADPGHSDLAPPAANPPDAPGSAPADAAPAGLTALSDVAGDWMEESLQLDVATRRDLVATETASTPTTSPPPERPARGPRADDVPAPAADAGTPPTFPGELEPAVETREATPAAVIPGRLCPAGHINAPHQQRCRVCEQPLDLDAGTITVERPVFAVAALPDERVIELDGATVLGRQPSADGARLADATVARIDVSSVSRTHVSIRVDGWRLLATDCGSTGGTALVPASGGDPLELTPWMPHEVAVGDVLYLGGPTAVTIREAPT